MSNDLIVLDTPIIIDDEIAPVRPEIKAGTVGWLIFCYVTDPASPYHKIRHRTRINYECMLRRINTDYGPLPLARLKFRSFFEWHENWSSNGAHIPMAHGLMGMVRTLVGFGMAYLEDKECERLVPVLHKHKFPVGDPRTQVLTAEQVVAIRERAHRNGLPMVALAQAIQFELTYRQKDIIGEWCPLSEPGMSDVVHERYEEKWLRGIRWSEIDARLVLRHVTSKKLKPDEADLTAAPMIMEEFGIAFCDLGEPVTRAKLPASGPVIVDPDTGLPFLPHKFRRQWRTLARECGIPDDVQNRDSRAGAITEAIESGVLLEDARKAAKHSTSQMTARYSREDAKAKARSMKQRAAARERGSPQEDVA